MNRPLGNMEQALSITDDFSPLTVVIVLGLTNAPAPDILEQALGILQRRHPLLHAKIDGVGSGHARFTASELPIPLRVIERRDDGHWQALVERALNTRVPAHNGPLMQCSYLRNIRAGGASELCFSLHHTIVDAVSGVTLLHELLGTLQALSAGQVIESAPLFLRPPAEEVFPAQALTLAKKFGFMLRQLQDEVRFIIRSSAKRRPPIHRSARCCPLTLEIDTEATNELICRCRRERLGLASALGAAMLLAVQQQLYCGVAMLGRGIYFADLRAYLKPPIPREILGCYISMMRYTVHLTQSKGRRGALWPLAHKIHEEVYQAGKRGEKFLAASFTKQLMKLALNLKAQRFAATAVSYAGSVLLEESYGDMKVDRLHSFISNNVLGPEYTAQAHLFRGRLCVNIVYLDKDMDTPTAKAIAADMIDLLLESEGEGKQGERRAS